MQSENPALRHMSLYEEFSDYLSDIQNITHTRDTSSNRRPPKRRRQRKHVPHRLQPVKQVTKRNTRERKRVDAINDTFRQLRSQIPYGPMSKRVSKENILKYAILYIRELSNLIEEHDAQEEQKALVTVTSISGSYAMTQNDWRGQHSEPKEITNFSSSEDGSFYNVVSTYLHV